MCLRNSGLGWRKKFSSYRCWPPSVAKVMERRSKKIMLIVLCSLLAIAIAVELIVNLPAFGKLPSGERLKRVEASPHYKNGTFQNEEPTVMMTTTEGRWVVLKKFLFSKKPDNIRPSSPVPSVKTDLRGLDPSKNLIVWFGHSSYLIQVDGKRILVDPVFFKASPVSFINRAFPGTKIYKPEDMPDIDYLVITHDHWDHLDYKTVKRLRSRVEAVICPLGVGSDLEYWGYPLGKIKEMDWYQDYAGGEVVSGDTSDTPNEGFAFHCLPTRHFSGRGLTSNKTLWASYLLETPSMKIFIGGDGGYDGRYLRIGKKYPGIDLAILENGQYNQSWKYIHTMPEYLDREVHELGASSVMTVHHSKYALARHPWDEPLKNELKLAQDTTIHVLIPTIGKPMKIGK